MHSVNWREVLIYVYKLTHSDLMQKACRFTTGADPTNMTLKRIYGCEHSPQRTQMFWVEMIQIPTFVSVHLVRHKIGVEHFVRSNRSDRGGDDEANRWTPINHAMLINAEALRNMALKRLCGKASPETREVMERIKTAVGNKDQALADLMVPKCEYIGRCVELRPCGRLKR